MKAILVRVFEDGQLDSGPITYSVRLENWRFNMQLGCLFGKTEAEIAGDSKPALAWELASIVTIWQLVSAREGITIEKSEIEISDSQVQIIKSFQAEIAKAFSQ